MLKKFLKVGEFAEQVGVPKHLVRKWDNDGLIEAHHKTSVGVRWYSWQQVAKVRELIQEGVLEVVRKA